LRKRPLEALLRAAVDRRRPRLGRKRRRMQITDEPRLTAGLSVPELPSLVVATMALAAECDRTPGGEKTMSTTCGDFKITLMNGTNDEIKVTKFEYKDGSIWKTEIGMFGADGHQKIEPALFVQAVRDGWRGANLAVEPSC
jgi:hypothetical protein